MLRPRTDARALAARLAPALLALGVLGCAGDTQPVATVGTTTITRGDYTAAAAGAEAQYPPEAGPAKGMLIEDLVRRRLLVLAARQRGLYEDSLTLRFRTVKEEEMLVQALGRALTPTGTAVTEAEMRRLYAWRDSSMRVQVIYALSIQAARAAADEARRGADFAQLADRFNPPGLIPPGGDIGFQTSGNLLSPLDEYLRTGAPGDVVGPLESPGQGWFVMKLGERVANPQPPFEDARRSLADMIRQRKHRASVFRAIRHLRETYALRALPGSAQVLFAHLNAPGGGPPAYSAEDLARPLAQWETKEGLQTYTFGDALADLDIAGREKPNALLLPSIEQWLLGETSRRLQVLEARRRGLDQDPEFRRQLDETVNNYLLEGLYSTEVLQRATPDPRDAVEMYQRNRSRFERLEGVSAQVIDFADSAAAAAFTAHSGHGADLHAAAAMVPDAPPVRDLTVRFPNPDPDWSKLHETLAAMNEGDAVGPYPVRGGWRITLIVLKQVRVTPFEALDADARAMLEQEGLELARERRLLDWIEELRRDFPVRVDSTKVARLPWPVPKQGG